MKEEPSLTRLVTRLVTRLGMDTYTNIRKLYGSNERFAERFLLEYHKMFFDCKLFQYFINFLIDRLSKFTATMINALSYFCSLCDQINACVRYQHTRQFPYLSHFRPI